MSTSDPRELAQLLDGARRSLGNGINHDFLRRAQIDKGWISQRAVIEEYYRLIARSDEDQLSQQRPRHGSRVKKWLTNFVGRRNRG